MSREQRRLDRKTQAKSGVTPSRRTPVRAGGRGLPVVPLLVGLGVFLVVGLLGYLIVQSAGEDDPTPAHEKAEQDDSPDIPGNFAPSQGRGHYSFGFTRDTVPMPFCEGVEHSPGADPETSATPSGSASAAATSTPQPSSTASGDGTSAPAGSETATASPTPPTDCRSTNPPTSGQHLGVQRNIDIGGGNVVNIPADPDVYPDDIELPRDSIPHILEHAGVFVGWNCAEGDQACMDVVDEVKDIVNDRIDNHDDRVVMAHDTELPIGQIGLASWTRWDRFDHEDFERDRVVRFIDVNSCRFDPENFCR